MMNAKELLRLMAAGRIALVDPTTSHPHLTQEIVHRALSLLAAAEASDGTTPETDDAAGTVHNNCGDQIEVTSTTFARRLERERNGLAAEVGRLLELYNRYINNPSKVKS
jgi:hypothetical protein